jgi:hypothetical protein
LAEEFYQRDTPGQLWDAFLGFLWRKWYVNPDAPMSVELDTYLGCRALRINTGPGVDPGPNYFVLTSLPAESIAPARWFTDSNGFQGCASIGSYGENAEFDIWGLYWAFLVVDLKRQMIDEWSDGVSGDANYSDVESLDGLMYSACATFSVTTETEALTTTEQLRVVWGYTVNEILPGPIVVTPLVCGPSLSMSVSLDTSAVVEALNQLAFQDFDIQFNHGQAIFSVRGKVNGG